jgi:hypothetical protein
MITGRKSSSNSISLSELNEDVDKLISSEKKKHEENTIDLKKFIEDEEDNNKIPLDIDKKILEMAEGRDFDLANSKKNKNKKKGLDFLNEELENLIKKTINEKKVDTKGTKGSDSLCKKKKKKKLIKKIKDSDEDINYSNNNTTNLFTINDYYYVDSDESSYLSRDEKELKDFINKKTCRKKNLMKYKDIYDKKMSNKSNIIVLNDLLEDSNSENNDDDIKENNDKNIEINKDEIINNNKKQFKRLKKNTDNKEMKLPLDTECIICTCIIKELANPDSCNHDFCKSCLIEWSQRSSKCPMCKTVYNNIFIYDDGIKKKISLSDIRNNYKRLALNEDDVENNNESFNIDEEDIDEGCYICGKNTELDKLLVCDRCKNNFCHYYCCGLNKIPEGKWFCGYCVEEIKEIKMNRRKIGHFFL